MAYRYYDPNIDESVELPWATPPIHLAIGDWLDTRTYNALWRAGYRTVEQVRQATDAELLGCRNLGILALNIIRRRARPGERKVCPIVLWDNVPPAQRGEDRDAGVWHGCIAAVEYYRSPGYWHPCGVWPRRGTQFCPSHENHPIGNLSVEEMALRLNR